MPSECTAAMSSPESQKVSPGAMVARYTAPSTSTATIGAATLGRACASASSPGASSPFALTRGAAVPGALPWYAARDPR
jgi:hypothetical protein